MATSRRIVRLVVGLIAMTTSARADEYQARYDEIVASRGTVPEAERLRALFAVDWEYTMAVSPESATYVGHSAHQTRWTDNSATAIAERKRFARRPLDVIATIDPTRLEPADRVNYWLFKRLAEETLQATRFPTEWLQVTQLSGVQHEPAQVFTAMKPTTTAELENVVARLRALPTLVAQATALLEEGLQRGVTPPQITLRDVPEQVAALVPEDPFASPLLVSFENLPATVPGEDGLRLRAEAARIYTEQVRPAYEQLRRFLTETYLPGTRVSTAAVDLPDGAAWYSHNIKTVTSLELTPREIHEIGLAEVKRIRAEMERAKERAGFGGSLQAFFTFMRTDPQFYFTKKEDLLRDYRDIAKRADPQLSKLFKTLPRTPYGVLPVPTYAEKSQTTAYYYPGSPDAGRPGYIFANTYALNTRPKWEMEALTLHEAVPGHHLQISLAQELENVPEFRKWSGYTAFVEGWGLYAESLGEEMGFYGDPYSKFGQLTYEMWRAVRLVVDTGMHALGWSREEAIQFFKENAGKNRARHCGGNRPVSRLARSGAGLQTR